MDEDILDRIERGELRLYELDKVLGDSNRATEVRRRYIEKKLGITLKNVGNTVIDFNEVVGRNAENTIGSVQVPLGIAGPLLVRGDYAKGMYYIPLATSEGALVASVNRGAKIVTESGGARSKVIGDAMTRAPVLKTRGIDEALSLVRWVRDNFDEVRRVAESTSRFARLIDVQPFIVGNNVWLRFRFTTGDAMGMNMVTKATHEAVKYIVSRNPGVRLVSLSGNLCSDKKPGAVNFLLGRGKTVISEVVVPRDYLSSKLGIEPEHAVEVNARKNLLGSALAHSYGYNAHFANIIAAVFLATGQDMAQVVESSMGITWMEVNDNGDLYASVTIPSLELGTVGGGTHLPTQREALSILGVAGPGDPPGTNSLRFAEILAAAVLAGELNLVLALARDELASAHERLGRGKLR